MQPLVAVAGFIHDVGSFLDEHPGGWHLLAKKIGKDATSAFFGGVYDHLNAAHNVHCLVFKLFVLTFLSLNSFMHSLINIIYLLHSS